MGLLSIIRKIKKKEKEMRILMVGLDNSGKTTIVLRINGEDTSVISPTLGFNIRTIVYQKYTLNIWDVGGQKTIRSYWRNYFEQTDGLVWVVDSSDTRRLEDCKMELHNLLKEEIVGVGFKARAESEGKLLYLKLGYSHEVELTVPPTVRVFCFKPNIVCCTGLDKSRVHQFAAAVRSCKPPEVYKGKGIMYSDEVIKKKQGKKSK